MWPISEDPTDPSEAIAWMRARAPVTRATWDALNAEAREKAFMVSGVAQLDLVAQAWTATDAAVKAGTTLAEFKEAIGASLESAWGGTVADPAWRLETIFRTNVQLAYSRGRFDQMTDPDVLEGRPFWMYDAILDQRTTEICRKCDGTTLPADDPFWRTHFTPAHFNCRAAITTLSEEEAHEQGVTAKAPTVAAEKGFGLTPSAANEWKPDPKDYPKELWQAHEAKPVPVVEPVKDVAFERYLKEYERFGDAAKPMAHARASEDDGMRISRADALKRLEAITETLPVHDRVAGYLRLAESAGADGTLADVAAYLKTQDSMPADGVEAVRVVAALFGHADRIEAIGKVDFVGAKTITSSTETAFDFLRKNISNRIQTGSITLEYGRGIRASFNQSMGNLLRVDQFDVAEIIVHEYAHALEHFDPKIGARAMKFLDVRAAGEPIEKLKDLQPDRGFGEGELTRKDKFRSPYVGKEYRRFTTAKRFATEVTSMGAEWITGSDAAQFLKEDPEHFYFTLGQFAGIE